MISQIYLDDCYHLQTQKHARVNSGEATQCVSWYLCVCNSPRTLCAACHRGRTLSDYHMLVQSRSANQTMDKETSQLHKHAQTKIAPTLQNRTDLR